MEAQGNASQYKPQRQGRYMLPKTGGPAHAGCSEMSYSLSPEWHRLKPRVLYVSQESNFKTMLRRGAHRKDLSPPRSQGLM